VQRDRGGECRVGEPRAVASGHAALILPRPFARGLDVRREFEQRNVKVKFDYAVLTRDDILKGIHPSDAELKAYYESNKARYTNAIPEKRKVRYALIDTTKLQTQTQVSRDELQTYYNQHREEFRVSEQVNIRHILIKTPVAGADGKTDPKGTEEARNKAADVLKQLKAGAKFEDLAKKYSDDPGSATNGGSLGWIGKGRTVPEFEKAAFALAKGGTSDLVQSSYGFHIIHVDDKQDAHLKSLDEVKAQIEPVVKQQKVAQVADTQGRDLVAATRANGLEKAAAAKLPNVITFSGNRRGMSDDEGKMRPPNATTRPCRSRIGNMTRSRKRSPLPVSSSRTTTRRGRSSSPVRRMASTARPPRSRRPGRSG